MPAKHSASALAKKHNRSLRDVLEALSKQSLIERQGDSWQLTDAGKLHGGEYRDSKQFGTYIVWPNDIFTNKTNPPPRGATLTSTKLGQHFELSPTATNKLLSEIGWISKHVKGWKITPSGSAMGGFEKTHPSSGVPYVMWPEDIIDNRILLANVNDAKGIEAPKRQPPPLPETAVSPEVVDDVASDIESFRKKFPAEYRCTDGHYVRSRAELTVDNWLYMSGLVHAYERKLPVEEDIYCDFYLPEGKVYIEYWGMEGNTQYDHRKKEKLDIYQKYGYNLIQLNDDDIRSLDDVLPRKLLAFGITSD